MRLNLAASALAAALLAWPLSARAATAGVHDEAGFFSPDAIAKADELIKDIKRDAQKELVIETFKSAPTDKRDEPNSADPKVKDRFFDDWAVRQAQDEQVNGIYVLICKEPPYIKPAVGNQTRREFSDEDRNRLGEILVDRFKKKEYDDGLLEAVRFVRSSLKDANGRPAGRTASQQGPATWPPYQGRPAGGDRPAPSGWGGWLCFGLVVVAVIGAGLWALSALFRGFQRGPMGYGPGNPGYGPGAYGYGPGGFMGGSGGGGGGGGFLPSVLGGLFGGAAGSWAYDRFGRPAASTQQGPPPAPPPDYTPEPPPVDTSFSAGGGGDFGGGDTGGGGGGDDAAGGGGAF